MSIIKFITENSEMFGLLTGLIVALIAYLAFLDYRIKNINNKYISLSKSMEEMKKEFVNNNVQMADDLSNIRREISKITGYLEGRKKN